MLKGDASITMLVNNAGVGATAPLLQSDVDAMESMITLNVNVLTRLAYAAAPAFVARGNGTIINIASIVAIAPEVLNGVYGGSKAYVLAFSQSLQPRTGRQGRARAGRAAGRHRDGFLGTSPARPSTTCRKRSSCPRRTWSTLRSLASPWAKWSRSRRCRTWPIGTRRKRAQGAWRRSCRSTTPAARYAVAAK